MKSILLALALMFVASHCCSFDVSGYLDKNCKLKLQTKTFVNQLPGLCQNGENANYPYYIWRCANNGIQLTYYSDSACTKPASSPEPIYYNNQCCGPSPANSNAYIITKIDTCCPSEMELVPDVQIGVQPEAQPNAKPEEERKIAKQFGALFTPFSHALRQQKHLSRMGKLTGFGGALRMPQRN